jgi:hypothetical protein
MRRSGWPRVESCARADITRNELSADPLAGLHRSGCPLPVPVSRISAAARRGRSVTRSLTGTAGPANSRQRSCPAGDTRKRPTRLDEATCCHGVSLRGMQSQRAVVGADRRGAACLGWAKRITPALLSAVVVFAVLYRLGESIMFCSLGSSIVATAVDLAAGHWTGAGRADPPSVVGATAIAVIGFLATLDLAGVAQSWAAQHVPAHTLTRVAVVVGACAVARCAVLLGGHAVDQRSRRGAARA